MCDNEYLAHRMVKERLREAEARGAFNAMVRLATTSPQPSGAGAASVRPWFELWWHAPAAWIAHLALPKIWNRL